MTARITESQSYYKKCTKLSKDVSLLVSSRRKISTKFRPSQSPTPFQLSTFATSFSTMQAPREQQVLEKHIPPPTRLNVKPLCSIFLARSINIGTALL